jgi:YVTN family beta-propeller protein
MEAMMRSARLARIRAALAAASIAATVVGLASMAPAQAARRTGPATAGHAHVIATIPLGQPAFNVATNPSMHMVYVTEPGGLAVIDGRTNKVVTTIPIPGKTSPSIVEDLLRNVATDPATGMVYVTDAVHDRVLVIDGQTNHVVATIDVGGAAYWIAADPVTGRVYVQVLHNTGSPGSPRVAVIDGQTNHLVAIIHETNPDAAGIAVNPRTNMVYVAGGSARGLLVINGKTDTVAATITGVDVQRVAVDPQTDTIYADYPLAEGPGVVYVINGRTDTVTRTIMVAGPLGMATDPLTHFLYIASDPGGAAAPGSALVINGRTGTVAASVPVGKFPVGIATDPLTNTVYVANVTSQSVSVLAGSS